MEQDCVFLDYGDCDGEVTFEPDPYAYDIYGDETPVWMCEKHRIDQALEV